MQRLPDWIIKQDPTISCVQEISFKYKDTDIFQNKRKKKYILHKDYE